MFISCWNFAKSLHLCWKIAIISAEQTDLVGLRILKQSIHDRLADCASRSGDENIETVVVPAEIHIIKMLFALVFNRTLRLWLVLYLNTNGIGHDASKEIHKATLFWLWLLLLIVLLIALHFDLNYNL